VAVAAATAANKALCEPLSPLLSSADSEPSSLARNLAVADDLAAAVDAGVEGAALPGAANVVPEGLAADGVAAGAADSGVAACFAQAASTSDNPRTKDRHLKRIFGKSLVINRSLNCTLRPQIFVQLAAMSLYPNIRFLTSAAEASQLAPDLGREVAFAGRSNSGKSTAINAITQRIGLARVSRTPGRTQLINFFEMAPERRLVDLPGYGYAKVPEAIKARWLVLLEHYFNVRESLAGLVLIVDSRRGLGAQDATMLEWVLARDRAAHVLLTKADKISRQDGIKVFRDTQAACSDTSVTVQLFSAHKKQGIEEVRAVMDGWLA